MTTKSWVPGRFLDTSGTSGTPSKIQNGRQSPKIRKTRNSVYFCCIDRLPTDQPPRRLLFFEGVCFNYRHPGPWCAWEWGSEPQVMTPLPRDPRDPGDPVDPPKNSETSIFDNPSGDFEKYFGTRLPKMLPKLEMSLPVSTKHLLAPKELFWDRTKRFLFEETSIFSNPSIIFGHRTRPKSHFLKLASQDFIYIGPWTLPGRQI